MNKWSCAVSFQAAILLLPLFTLRKGSQDLLSYTTRRGATIGQSKLRYGLGLIREKLAVTQGSTIAMNLLVMNLEKLLELLFVLFACWLQLLLVSRVAKDCHSELLGKHGAAA